MEIFYIIGFMIFVILAIKQHKQKYGDPKVTEGLERQEEEIAEQYAEAEKLLDREKLKNADKDVLTQYLEIKLERKRKLEPWPKHRVYVEKIDDLKVEDSTCCVKLNFGKAFPNGNDVGCHLVDVIYSIFDASPKINTIVISGYHAFIDSKGWEKNLCFISVKVDREEAYSLKRENLSAGKILDNFDTRHGYEKDKKGQIVRVTAIYAHEDLDKMSYPSTQEEKEAFTIDIVDKISPEQFEQLTTLLLKKMNFIVEHVGQTGDGGIDIKAQNLSPITSGKYIIQCKRYNIDNKVDVKDIRDLFGVIHSEMANKGILITTSAFTKKAIDFARGKPIELIDGGKLKKLLAQFLPELFKK